MAGPFEMGGGSLNPGGDVAQIPFSFFPFPIYEGTAPPVGTSLSPLATRLGACGPPLPRCEPPFTMAPAAAGTSLTFFALIFLSLGSFFPGLGLVTSTV